MQGCMTHNTMPAWLDPLICFPPLTNHVLSVLSLLQCYLNSEAEHCDSPLCERMAISIQGGLYVSCAYGDTEGPTSLATLEETCLDGQPDVPLPEALKTDAKKASEARNKMGPAAKDITIQQNNFFTDIIELFFDFGYAALGNVCGGGIDKRWTAKTPAAKAPKAPVKVASEYEYKDEAPATKLYSGLALIISGPFYETSKHDGKIEETGLFEFAPVFSGGAEAGTEPTSRYPVVRAKSAKLRFTRAKEGYYGKEGDRSA